MGKFCKLPWLSVTISTAGHYAPCCAVNNFIHSTSWDEYQSSPELAKLKEEFLAGKQPLECVKCWTQEDADLESLRTMTMSYAERYPINYGAINDPVQIELAITQICNSACRICGPDSSSRWIKDNNQLFKIGLADEYNARAKRHLTDPEYVEWVLTHQQNLKYLQFIGGEPFADQIKEQADLLNKLEHPGDIQLSYMTNGTFTGPQLLEEQWQKFKRVNISVSLDGCNEVFEYGRYPAKWNDVESNLTYWKTLARDNDNIHLNVNNTISAINIFNIPEFDAWASASDLNITYQILSNPSHYDIRNLNPEVKTYLSRKLYQFPEIISGLNKEPNNFDYNSLVNYLRALDDLRGQSFVNLYPSEYTKLFHY